MAQRNQCSHSFHISALTFLVLRHFPRVPCHETNAGYPVLTGLNHLLSRIIKSGALPGPYPPARNKCVDVAHGTVALAANVCSAIFGATTALLLTFAIETWLSQAGTTGTTDPSGTRGAAGATGAASTAAVLFSLSPLAWEYHTGFEVFALNNALIAAGLLLAVRVARRPNTRDACIGAVVRLAISSVVFHAFE